MKKNLNKLTKVLTAAFLAAGVLAGCSTSQTEASKEAVPESQTAQSQIAENTAALEGTITMAGSTSMEKLANAAAESFMAKYPKVTVTAEFTGSSAGIEAVLAGTVDIGNPLRMGKIGGLRHFICLMFPGIVGSEGTIRDQFI